MRVANLFFTFGFGVLVGILLSVKYQDPEYQILPRILEVEETKACILYRDRATGQYFSECPKKGPKPWTR